MNDPRITHFLGMFAYETWANQAVFESLAGVPPEQTGGPAFTRALQISAHIQLARRVWLARLEGRSELPAEWFPAWKQPELRQANAEMDRAWHAYLLKLTSAELDRDAIYTSSEGIKYASSVQEILAHIFNHSTYHRGQIARLVTEAGGRRATTDLIARTRRVI